MIIDPLVVVIPGVISLFLSLGLIIMLIYVCFKPLKVTTIYIYLYLSLFCNFILLLMIYVYGKSVLNYIYQFDHVYDKSVIEGYNILTGVFGIGPLIFYLVVVLIFCLLMYFNRKSLIK